MYRNNDGTYDHKYHMQVVLLGRENSVDMGFVVVRAVVVEICDLHDFTKKVKFQPWFWVPSERYNFNDPVPNNDGTYDHKPHIYSVLLIKENTMDMLFVIIRAVVVEIRVVQDHPKMTCAVSTGRGVLARILLLPQGGSSLKVH